MIIVTKKKTVKKGFSINFGTKSYMFIITALFFGGFIAGCLLISITSDTNYNMLSSLFNLFTENRYDLSVFIAVQNIFLSSFFYIFALFLMGLWAVGIPFIFIIIAARGISVGLSVGFIFMTYGLQGLAFNSVVYLPISLLTILALTICSKPAINMSLGLAKNIIYGSTPYKITPADYLEAFGIATIVTIVASIAEALLNKLFIFLV